MKCVSVSAVQCSEFHYVDKIARYFSGWLSHFWFGNILNLTLINLLYHYEKKYLQHSY